MRITIHLPADTEKELRKVEGQSISSYVAEAVRLRIHLERRKGAGDRVRALIGSSSLTPGALREMRKWRDADRA